MFLMFSLRRPDVLPVGDLGVQKGLLRWALAAHGHLPKSKSGKVADEARKKYGLTPKKEVVVDHVDESGSGEIDTTVQDRAATPTRSGATLPPTPLTPTIGCSGTIAPPHLAALHTPGPGATRMPEMPNTPGTSLAPPASASSDIKPDETLETSGKDLLPPAPETFLEPLPHNSAWDAHRAAPLNEGLSVELMKSRLSGKKAKGGAYLTAAEMDVLTEGWKPFRSLGVYYMWPAGEEF
jgi:DNA-3-methyladenine glycosylase II